MKQRERNEVLMLPDEAARMFGLSGQHVRHLIKNGALPCQRTPGGHYILRGVDVEPVLAPLAARKKEKAVAA